MCDSETNILSNNLLNEEDLCTHILLNPSDIRIPTPPKPKRQKIIHDLYLLINLRGLDSFEMWIEIWKQLLLDIVS